MARLNVKKAKFYCESCGSEVPQNAKFCGTCGKFFTFTRCPQCLYTGESKIFTNGCPKCGYAVKPFGGLPSQHNSSSNRNKGNLWGNIFGSSRAQAVRSEDSSLPIWIYVVVITALVAVVFGFYSCL